MYCRYCGANNKSGRYCTRCGAVLDEDDRGASQAYRSFDAQTEVNRNDYYNAPRGYGYESTGRRGADMTQTTTRTGAQTFICFISGLVGLAVLGVLTYFLLMGNMFVDTAGQVLNPFTGAAGSDSFALVYNFNLFPEIFSGYGTYFATFAGMSFEEIVSAVCLIIPSLLMMLGIILCIIFTGIGTIAGLFSFIGGMLSKRNFSIARWVGLAMTGYLILFFSANMFGYGAYTVSLTASILLGMMLCAIAFVVMTVLNIVYAGKRALNGGAIMKLITNALMLASVVILIWFFPYIVSASGTVNGEFFGIFATQLPAYIASFTSGSVDIFSFVMLAMMFVYTILMIYIIPHQITKAAVRLAKTYKFNGKKDKGYILNSIGYLISVALFVVPAYILFNNAVNFNVNMLIVSAAVMFVCSIVNRVVLNADQPQLVERNRADNYI